MSFSSASLLAQLMRYPTPQAYVVAYSGGCDSHVLLHALAEVREQLPTAAIRVLHINHGLQSQAAQWEAHCANVCERLKLDYDAVAVQVRPAQGQSPEAAARDARYAAFTEQLKEQEMLLMAHHQDDQAETLMLQLLRGSGVKGLAAMPELTSFAGGWLARPLLFYTREVLCDYARACQLQWIEDPSNFDTDFDRNYLRHEVFPTLKMRWPSISVALSRASEHQAEAMILLNDLARMDFDTVKTADSHSVQIAPLLALSPGRQRNVLRYWIGEVCARATPDSKHLERILGEVLSAAEDAEPAVDWAGQSIRRFRGRLYLLDAPRAMDASWRANWDAAAPLELPGPVGELYPRHKLGAGIARRHLARGLEVGFRQGGERVRLPGREHSHALKKLLQEWGVPPWERDRIPLVFIDGQLAQVVGYCVCESFAAGAQEEGVDILLRRQ